MWFKENLSSFSHNLVAMAQDKYQLGKKKVIFPRVITNVQSMKS